MTIIFAAATVPVNPAGAYPVMTLKQLWAGLELKRRMPQLFLAVIDTCEVLEDDGESVLREVKFKDGGGVGMPPVIGPKVQERITHIKPLSEESGSGLETFTSIGSASRVLNIVSTGIDGGLNLTFSFEWDHEDIEAGSHAAVEKQKEYQATAPKGVAGTLNAIREMVKEGRL
ncbi:hypothetical protein OIDMADRAFT_206545 [Oidiodendron maius Zn]|uniref:Bet v I/Major latex protein domain-containing protein n=1 Tax=Oidiodendron maius (strain Zn) TaxID=913774 RepID=A0A0C3CYR9_OIDMZ|nr:hypothetical protein OIDMADRAFT_206545 [Oidiodendron maius Zn]